MYKVPGKPGYQTGPLGKKGPAKGNYPVPPGTPGGPTPPAAAPAPSGPAAPARVDPFFTPDDLLALNDFTTRYATELQNIDFELGNLQSDTTYQKTNNDKTAKENTAQSQDVMAARGLFQSSIKDAALYDIEASRSLANKFLDDKMQAATLNAGTQKKVLADSKKRFDEAMIGKETQNATGVNDANSSAWASAMAAWTQAHPAPAPVAPAAKPAAPAKPAATSTGGLMNPQAVAQSIIAKTYAQKAPKPPRLAVPKPGSKPSKRPVGTYN